jgi:hypothetical protein
LVPAQPARGALDGAGTKKEDLEPYETHLVVGPAALALNASAPVSAGGWISAKGYRFFLRGDAELQDLFRLEEFLGLTAVRPAAEGSARLDVNLSGPWQGFTAPLALGTIQLHNVRAEMHGLNTPIAINAAVVSVTPDLVWINKISAATGGTHWSGMITSPRHCASLGCVFHFDLAADQLSSADLGNWLTPRSDKRPWYHILSSAQPPGKSPLLAIQAEGNLRVTRFTLKRLLATQVDTQVDVDRGKITLTDLRGQLLQGTHQGNWTIDLSTRDDVASRDTPAGRLHYRGTGNLHDISLAQVGLLMNDPWIAGTGDASFDLDTSGSTFPDLLARSDGRLEFVMRNGSLPHIELPGSGGHLPVHRFTGQLRLEKGAWEISDGKLESRDGIYQVSGTASVAAGCDFLLSLGGERAWKLTGTLAKPQVAATGHAENTRAQADAIVESKIKP